MPWILAWIPIAANNSNKGFLVLMRGSVTARDGMTANLVCGGSRLTLGFGNALRLRLPDF